MSKQQGVYRSNTSRRRRKSPKLVMFLGILAIVLPIVMELVAGVIGIILLANIPEVAPEVAGTGSTEITFASSLGTGVMMLLFALIFKHGAELNEAQKKANMEKDALEKKVESAKERRGYYY